MRATGGLTARYRRGLHPAVPPHQCSVAMKVPDASHLTHLFGFANCPPDARSQTAIVIRNSDSRYLKLIVIFCYKLDVG
jgi:hypothetical protein